MTGDAAVPSPCIGVCAIDAATGLCTGCRRTLDEIAAWGTLDDAAKRAIVDSLGDRPAGSLDHDPHRLLV